MAMSDFRVNVPSGFSNPDVANLSETEIALSPSYGGKERFRRLKREYLMGEEQLRTRGRELGGIIQADLDKVSPAYRVSAVNWNNNGTWTVEVDTPTGPKNVVLDWFLVDDVISARTQSELQRLRNLVLFGLGRRDLIFGGRK